MDLTALINEVKKLADSLLSYISKAKEKGVEFDNKILVLNDRSKTLDDKNELLKEREVKVSKIESAQALLNAANVKNKECEEKKVELFDREKQLAGDEAKLGDDQEKLRRELLDLGTKNSQLTRDWTIFNKQKKEFEEKNK